MITHNPLSTIHYPLSTAHFHPRMNDPTIIARFHPELPLHTDFAHPGWEYAQHLTINLNWRGEEAPPQLHTAVRILWNREELLFGFECGYTELDIDEEFDL